MKYLLIATLIIITQYSQCQNTLPDTPNTKSEDMVGIVEVMPRFPGCENQNLNNRELEKCSKTKMIEYVYSNLVYPAILKDSIVSTRAVVSFSVETNGTLGNIKVVRDPGSGLGQAAANVIHKMNKDGLVWVPGKQRGRVVVVKYNLPINFELD